MKRVLSVLLSLSLMIGLLSVASVATAADNLAVNGDLELGTPNGWEIDNATIDSSVVYAGNYSLKLNSTAAYSGAAYKAVPVRKNATVMVSFYYRYTTNPGSYLYYVYTYKGADPWTGNYSDGTASFKSSGAVNGWKQISYTFNSGDFTSIYLKFAPGGVGGTPCYIDNLTVTSVGGDETEEDPYLNSFGTKNNVPIKSEYNLIKNGGFESTANAQWNTSSFIKGDVSVVTDPTAPEGYKSLYFNGGNTTTNTAYTFPVSVEKYTQYTFSAWVKSPRLSATNMATATFGVMNANNNEFLVYEPYNGNGYGTASLSTTSMQLMATAPDDEWHLRSVTFYSGSHTTVNIGICGVQSQLWLDDLALFKKANGVEYISDLRSVTLTSTTTTGGKYCADDMSLIPAPHMTGKAAENHWSSNPAWRNGFLSFTDTGDSHETALKYTASAHPEWQLHYIDWIDVTPGVNYTLTLDVKRLTAGGGRIALLDDNVLSPAEFYSIPFSATDRDWQTYSITFNTEVYSRIGFAIVDAGGSAYIDKVRLFESALAVSQEPSETKVPYIYPTGGKTAVMETGAYVSENLIKNSDFEGGHTDGWLTYQGTLSTPASKRQGAYGAHLKGDGGWGAMLEQRGIPVVAGEQYELVFWYKAVSNGANWSLFGEQSGKSYASGWANSTTWQAVRVTFTCNDDTTLWLNICGGGNGIREELYMDDFSLTCVSGGPPLGVAFRMELETVGAAMDEHYRGYLDNATVDVYGDGVGYSLKKMGCVVTNRANVASDRSIFTLDNLSEDRTVIDVPAVYLCEVTDTTAAFAVRVINIPYKYRNALIYARPYYVVEVDGKQQVIYGDIYSRSYTDPNGNGNFTIP